MPLVGVNVPGDYLSLAGFEVTMYGRFWVIPEGLREKILQPLHKATESPTIVIA